jgi:hypothetical protein
MLHNTVQKEWTGQPYCQLMCAVHDRDLHQLKIKSVKFLYSGN